MKVSGMKTQNKKLADKGTQRTEEFNPKGTQILVRDNTV